MCECFDKYYSHNILSHIALKSKSVYNLRLIHYHLQCVEITSKKNDTLLLLCPLCKNESYGFITYLWSLNFILC